MVVDGEVNRDAAWYYPTTKDEAKHVERYVAFWNGVAVEHDDPRSLPSYLAIEQVQLCALGRLTTLNSLQYLPFVAPERASTNSVASSLAFGRCRISLPPPDAC